jgi:hypothetical protein
VIDHMRRNLVAYLALFVALGGTSYAAARLAPDSVGTAQIKNGAVTNPKLANGAVSVAKIATGVLRGLTASAFSDDNAVQPTAGGIQHVVKQVKITLRQPGKLLVLDSALYAASIDNTGNTPQFYDLAVYVDGVGVPGTFVNNVAFAPANTTTNANAADVGPGVATNVAAGTHTVQLVLRTTGATGDFVTSSSGRLLVLGTG